MDRIMGALTFRKGVYTEVENDPSFTPTAWAIVFVSAFLSQLGANSADGSLDIVAALVGAVFATITFAAFAWIIAFAGKTLFQADVSFSEMVRATGLAYVWNAVGVLGLLALIGDALACVAAPIVFVGAILWIVSTLMATREALDLDWGRSLVVVLIAVVVYVIIAFIFGLIAAAIGLGVSLLGGAAGAVTP
ncbi:MAG: YIP1 family protein [Candidatus Promineifilaceae bacterium]